MDATGLIVAPGFIDIHNHSDASLFACPGAENYTAQGVTTIIVGNCGHSAAPRCSGDRDDPVTGLADDCLPSFTSTAGYLAEVERLGPAVNVGTLVGHGTVRGLVVGNGDRPATQSEMDAMKEHVREAMTAGALGFSTGLIYAPGIYAAPAEIAGLAGVAAAFGGLYVTHLRNESDLMVEAVMEAVDAARASGSRLQISHHKASGRRNWGLVRTTLAMMEQARLAGVEVTCDVYPCTASATGLWALFPAWARDGGKEATVRLLADSRARARIKKDLSRPSLDWENILFDAGYDGIMITRSHKHPEFQGMTMSQIASEQGIEQLDALLNLAGVDPDTGVVAGGMSEDDVKYVLGHRLSIVGSDGSAARYGEGCPHPRSYRAFTRTLATYARDEMVLSLEAAVSKMTGLPAWKLGLSDRGILRPGFAADLAVFDYWELSSDSDFGDPHHYARGMVHLMVNGQMVIEDGKATGIRPGKLVRKI